MKQPKIWRELFATLRTNVKSIAWSLLLGMATSTLTALAEFVYGLGTFLSQVVWFRNLGLPLAWIGIWKGPQTTLFLGLRFFFYPSSFLQNWLFWAAISFVLVFIRRMLAGELPVPLLPVFVLALGSARIQLEFEMAVAAFGSILRFARIDPFSYAHIVSYFAMALLLFPAVITLVSKLPFREVVRLSWHGLPVIWMPPILDNYVLHRPLIYNFYTSEFFDQPVDPLRYLTVVSSTGIRLEAILVAALTLAYVVYRTRSLIRSFAAVVAVIAAFVAVTTPIVTAQFHLTFSQPQFFAGFLILTYILLVVDLGLAHPKMGSTIIRRMRLRGIHFPAMVIFGTFLVHPTILSAGVPEDYGSVLAAGFIAFLVWQAATVFDDIYDRREMQGNSVYSGYGFLTASIAVLAAIPFGLIPWLLTVLPAYLALDYPRLRRRHYLLSGVVIGIASSISFLFGTSIPAISPEVSQPVGLIALGLFVLFSGGSLVKDIATVEEDNRLGIETVFTKFEMSRVLPIVATFVAAGCMLPILLLNALSDLILSLGMAIAAWLLIVLTKERAYRPVLVLYFMEGTWIFFRLFVVH